MVTWSKTPVPCGAHTDSDVGRFDIKCTYDVYSFGQHLKLRQQADFLCQRSSNAQFFFATSPTLLVDVQDKRFSFVPAPWSEYFYCMPQKYEICEQVKRNISIAIKSDLNKIAIDLHLTFNRVTRHWQIKHTCYTHLSHLPRVCNRFGVECLGCNSLLRCRSSSLTKEFNENSIKCHYSSQIDGWHET